MDPNYVSVEKGDTEKDADSDAEDNEEEDDCFHEEDMVEQLHEFAEMLEEELD